MLTSRRATRGMVVAPHHLAAQAGLRILREEKAIYPEAFDGFSLTTFEGESITV